MAHTALFTTDKNNEEKILIIDKNGIIGKKLLITLRTTAKVILITDYLDKSLDGSLIIPFKKMFSRVNKENYSHVIIIDERAVFGKKDVERLIKLSQNIQPLILYLIGKNYLSQKKYAELAILKSNVKFGILGDIFEEKVLGNFDNEVNSVLRKIKNEWKILIPGDGTTEINPVFIDDVADSILEICFSDLKEKIFFIYPKNKITFLTFAAAFKKIHPEIRLDFINTKHNTHRNANFLTGRYILGENYNLVEKIKKINFQNIVDYEKSNFLYLSNKKTNKTPVLITSVFFIFLIILPLLNIIGLGMFSKLLVDIYPKILLSKNQTNLKVISISSQIANKLYSPSSVIVKTEAQWLKIGEIFTNWDLKNKNDYLILDSINDYLKFEENLLKVLNGQVNNPKLVLKDALMFYYSAIYKFNLANVEKTQIIDLEQQFNMFNFPQTSVFLNNLLAINSKKSYIYLISEDVESPKITSTVSASVTIWVENGKITVANFELFKKPTDISSVLASKADVSGIIISNNIFFQKIKELINNNKSDSNKVSTSDYMYFVDSFSKNKINIFLKDENIQDIFNEVGR